MAAKKNFTGALDQIRKTTGIDEPAKVNPDTKPAAEKKTTAKKTKEDTAATKQLNVAIDPELLDYLKAYCKWTGISQSEAVSDMIRQSMKDNADILELVQKLWAKRAGR